MTDEAKQAKREYYRAWAKAHPDNVRRHQETFWERKAAEKAAELDSRLNNSEVNNGKSK